MPMPSKEAVRNRLAIVVEDDDALRATLVELLEAEGYAATSVSTLQAARIAMASVVPGVVVLDLSLADEDGASLLAELARDEDAPPVVILSARPDAAWLAVEYGVGVLGKPFHVDDFARQLGRARRERRRPRALFDEE